MTATRLPRILVDVTQYSHWPATSGVQRVLLRLARDWSGEAIEARFGFIDDQRYLTGPLSELGSLMDQVFAAADSGATLAESVRDDLHACATQTVAVSDVEPTFDGYLLPEPTLRIDNLTVARRLRQSRRAPAFFVYYDALPLTHPELYPRGTDAGGEVSRYHRCVVASDNVAFISQKTRETFESRIARRKSANSIVARPGADSFPRALEVTPEIPTFAVLGTVEPRKRHRLIVEAFERLWAAGRDYRLVVIGAPGWEEPAFLGRLRSLSRTSRIEWIEEAGDRIVAEVLARSTGVVFTPFAEGYGLPAMEALANGCPVIVNGDLPALDGLPADGQIRLETVTPEDVASAIETLADPSSGESYRRAAKEIRLPTWREFASDVEQWIASTLGGGRNGGPNRLTR